MAGRIQIRELNEDDCLLVSQWIADPEINQWLYAEWRGRPVSDKLIKIAANGPKNEMRLALVDDMPYGLICIGGIEQKDRSGVIWYLRGSGVARHPGAMVEAVKLVCKDVFENCGLESISGSLQAANEPSRKVLEAVGFKPVGTMRRAFCVDGQFVDRKVFDLLPSDLV